MPRFQQLTVDMARQISYTEMVRVRIGRCSANANNAQRLMPVTDTEHTGLLSKRS